MDSAETGEGADENKFAASKLAAVIGCKLGSVEGLVEGGTKLAVSKLAAVTG